MDCSHVGNGGGPEDRKAQTRKNMEKAQLGPVVGVKDMIGLVKKKKSPKKVILRIKVRTSGIMEWDIMTTKVSVE